MGTPAWKTIDQSDPLQDPELQGLLDSAPPPTASASEPSAPTPVASPAIPLPAPPLPSPAGERPGETANDQESDQDADEAARTAGVQAGPPETTPQTNMPWYDALGRGFANMASAGFADELAGLGSAASSLVHGEPPRASGPGVNAPPVDQSTWEQLKQAYRQGRDAWRGQDVVAQQQHPNWWRGGEGAGLLASLAIPMGAESDLGRIGIGAMQGGVTATGQSNAGGAQLLKDAAEGAVTGGTLGYAGGKVGDWLARKLGSAAAERAQGLQREADKQYLRSAGARKGDLDRLEKMSGGVSRYAAGGRRLGIGKPALGFIPRTTEGGFMMQGYADQAAQAAAAKDVARRALEDQIVRSGAEVDPQELAAGIRAMKNSYAPGGFKGQQLRDTIDQIAEQNKRMAPPPMQFGIPDPSSELAYTIQTRIAPKAALQRGARGRFETAPGIPLQVDVMKRPPDIPATVQFGIPWQRANLERRTMGDVTNFASDALPQKIQSGTYGALNDALANAAERTNPQAGQAWRNLGEDEHVALMLRDLGRQRENMNASNRMIGLTDTIAGGAGAAMGGIPGAGTAIVANKLLRGYEHPLMESWLRNNATAMRGASNLLSTAGGRPMGEAGSGMLPGLVRPELPRTTQYAATAALNNVLGPQNRQLQGFDQATQPTATGQQQRADLQNQANGSMLNDAAKQVLRTSPQQLGPYAQQFQQAQQSGDAGALSALLNRLMQDPKFRQTVLPVLQQQTLQVNR